LQLVWFILVNCLGKSAQYSEVILCVVWFAIQFWMVHNWWVANEDRSEECFARF